MTEIPDHVDLDDINTDTISVPHADSEPVDHGKIEWELREALRETVKQCDALSKKHERLIEVLIAKDMEIKFLREAVLNLSRRKK